MSDWTLRAFSTVIVAGLALADAPNAASADHCKGKPKNDPGCSSGGDGDITGVQPFGQQA